MPAPRWVARANRVGLNRIVKLIAPWAPGFGMIVHRGRRSGSAYRTPVNIFHRGDGYVVALTYGPESDWVQNVLAADGCDLEIRRRHVRLVEPRLYRDRHRRGMPFPVRAILGLINVDYFLAMKAADQGASPPHTRQ